MMARSPKKDAAQESHPLSARMRARRADLERQVEATRAQFGATNEKIQEKAGRNLLLAIVMGLVFGGIFFVSLVVVKQLFIVLAVALTVVAGFELTAALRTAGRFVPAVPLAVGFAALMPLGYYGAAGGVWGGIAAVVALTLVARLASQIWSRWRTSASQLVSDLAVGVFVALYIGLLSVSAVVLTAHPGGQWWVLAFIIVVIVIDTAAYVTGLTLGRHPMARRISPKKTWEGLAGAVVASVVAGILLAVLLLDQPWWFGVVFGIALTVSATFGDLAESLIKRDLGIKDMSSWLPGHGGLLDRLDSILPSAAVTYLLYIMMT